MNTSQITYLAGLLEGEGCFRINRFKRNPAWAYPEVIVGSIDLDVLKNAQRISGVGRVYSRKLPDNPRHKQCHIWEVTKTAEAHALMRSVLPYMGARRTAKIEEVLAETKG